MIKVVGVWLFLVFPMTAQAGSWNAEQQSGLIIIEANHLKAQKGIESGQTIRFQNAWRDDGVQIYGEYGLTDKIMVMAKIRQQYSERSYGPIITKARLGGPHSIGVQYQLSRSDHSVSAMKLDLEGLGDGSQLAHLLTGPKTKPQTVFGLSHGRNLKINDIPVFLDMSLAHRGGPQSYSEAQLVIGSNANIKSWARPMLKLRAGRTNEQADLKASWLELDISTLRPISKNLSVQLGYRHNLAGQNIAQFQGPYLGLWQRF